MGEVKALSPLLVVVVVVVVKGGGISGRPSRGVGLSRWCPSH